MSTKLLAYVVISAFTTAIFFGALVFVSTVMSITVPYWIITLFLLIAGNCLVSFIIFFIHSFKNSGED